MIRKIFYSLISILFSFSAYAEQQEYEYEIIADNLSHPWGIAVIDKDNILFTELSGQLRVIEDGVLNPEPIKGVPEVLFAGQGGLSGIILDPNFDSNNKIYISFSSPDEGRKTNTLEVISSTLTSKSLEDVKTIFKASPSRKTAAHYGARMAFLDDGTLLITSGDGFNYREQAQYLDNHFGKIIRINTDGTIPEDNPFVSGQPPSTRSAPEQKPLPFPVIITDRTCLLDLALFMLSRSPRIKSAFIAFKTSGLFKVRVRTPFSFKFSKIALFIYFPYQIVFQYWQKGNKRYLQKM